MSPRAENPNSLSGPTGPSLLDQSKATPADLNRDIFKPAKPTRQSSEGTVSNDYLKRTREEDPWPAQSSCAPKSNTPVKTATVTLSDCRIDTPIEDLATDQPFQMSCQATTTDGSPLKGDIRFKLYCTLPDGTEEFTNHTVIAKRNGERYSAEGTLFSPKKPVEWGAPLKYHVVAEHPGAAEKARSGVEEVVGYMPLKAVAIWRMSSNHFKSETSFILPSAVNEIGDLKKVLAQYPGMMMSIFGHSGVGVSNLEEKRISGRRGYAVYSLLTSNVEGWIELSQCADEAFWGNGVHHHMLTVLKDSFGVPYYDESCEPTEEKLRKAVGAFQSDQKQNVDGSIQGDTKKLLYSKYMQSICDVKLKSDAVLGASGDERLKWACNACGGVNPMVVKSKTVSPRAEINQGDESVNDPANDRVSIIVFQVSPQQKKRIRFPCCENFDSSLNCAPPLFDDHRGRHTVTGARKEWEQTKNTFACRFYASIAERENVNPKYEQRVYDSWFEDAWGRRLDSLWGGMIVYLIVKSEYLIGECVDVNLSQLGEGFDCESNRMEDGVLKDVLIHSPVVKVKLFVRRKRW